jgi:hypothetical protein
VAEGKDVGDFSDPQEVKDAVRHATDLYDEHFAKTGLAPAKRAA